MKIYYRLLVSLLVCIVLAGAVMGCASKEVAAPSPAIQYEIGQGAEIAKVSWYVDQGNFSVFVDVKNVSSVPQKFEVAVKVDNEAFFIAGRETETAVSPGKTLTYGTQTAIAGVYYPKRLTIRIVPL